MLLTQQAQDPSKDAQDGRDTHPACHKRSPLAVGDSPFTVAHLSLDGCDLGKALAICQLEGDAVFSWLQCLDQHQGQGIVCRRKEIGGLHKCGVVSCTVAGVGQRDDDDDRVSYPQKTSSPPGRIFFYTNFFGTEEHSLPSALHSSAA